MKKEWGLTMVKCTCSYMYSAHMELKRCQILNMYVHVSDSDGRYHKNLIRFDSEYFCCRYRWNRVRFRVLYCLQCFVLRCLRRSLVLLLHCFILVLQPWIAHTAYTLSSQSFWKKFHTELRGCLLVIFYSKKNSQFKVQCILINNI